jgi:hypothetical protein
MLASPMLVALLLSAEPSTGGRAFEPILPEQAAAIALDAREAQAEVSRKYGNKKPSELSNEERLQMIRDQAAAEQRVLDKHGVDRRTWARQQMAQSPKEVAAQQALEKQLAEKRQAEAKAKEEAEKQGGEKEVQVQRGFSDANPVTMEELPSEGVPVEQGLPPDAAADLAEAAGRAGSDLGEVEDAAKSASKGGKSSRSKADQGGPMPK